MIIYGTALLASCHMLGILLGDLLGSLLGVQANSRAAATNYPRWKSKLRSSNIRKSENAPSSGFPMTRGARRSAQPWCSQRALR